MVEPKFKKGDVCRVVRRNAPKDSCEDEGSNIRTGFVIENINASEGTHIYWPKDDEQGAYECQLELEKVDNWKEIIENE